jgi:predicted HTH domain antitoxin
MIFLMAMVMETDAVGKQVNALIEGGYYPNKAEFVEDAISAFFELRKDMKIASVIELYKKEELSISKAAELAGLDMDEMKRVLVEERVGILRGFTKDRRTAASELSGMV